jgi:hypothetical protein
LPYEDVLIDDTKIDGLDGCKFPDKEGSANILEEQYNTILPADALGTDNADELDRPRGLTHPATKLEGQYPEVYQEGTSILHQTMLHEHGWPESTAALCHWCCHAFDERPYGIPVARVADKFKVIGNFCSLECASAHNFDTSKGSEMGKERNVFINELSMMMGDGCEKITPAPPRCVLKLFGGDMNIDKFRNMNSKIKLLYPPRMIVENQFVEEIDTHVIQKGARYVPIDDDKLKRFKDSPEMKLKRKKPREGHMPSLDSILAR